MSRQLDGCSSTYTSKRQVQWNSCRFRFPPFSTAKLNFVINPRKSCHGSGRPLSFSHPWNSQRHRMRGHSESQPGKCLPSERRLIKGWVIVRSSFSIFRVGTGFQNPVTLLMKCETTLIFLLSRTHSNSSSSFNLDSMYCCNAGRLRRMRGQILLLWSASSVNKFRMPQRG